MISLILLLGAAHPLQSSADSLREAILSRISRDSGATVAVVLRDPVQGFFVAVNPDLRFHAGNEGRVYVLNKGDGVIRVLTP